MTMKMKTGQSHHPVEIVQLRMLFVAGVGLYKQWTWHGRNAFYLLFCDQSWKRTARIDGWFALCLPLLPSNALFRWILWWHFALFLVDGSDLFSQLLCCVYASAMEPVSCCDYLSHNVGVCWNVYNACVLDIIFATLYCKPRLCMFQIVQQHLTTIASSDATQSQD